MFDNAVSTEPETVIAKPKQPERVIAEPRPGASEPLASGDCKNIGVTDAWDKQQEEADLVQQVEVRFYEFNALLCKGTINQEMPLQLRDKTVEELNDIDEQACEALLL